MAHEQFLIIDVMVRRKNTYYRIRIALRYSQQCEENGRGGSAIIRLNQKVAAWEDPDLRRPLFARGKSLRGRGSGAELCGQHGILVQRDGRFAKA